MLRALPRVCNADSDADSGMLVSVHPAVSPKDWGFGDFQSLRASPGGHPVQPIEASQLGLRP